ncbi:hypothetical protein J4U01_gp114 [Mycobacterium phage Kumao]|uniref:Uncharacterized protein n=1 Tax=Mycobacterium phage Kumao TaxID=2041344 RepID=A0A2D1GPW8_9CAUD|nr:hypothetical protein J4U01_gp114 [Mycobacterium phage Kumao]ATN94044.1 hypothetical protein SEA_KUMAO_82 [Mycobacterium phage Kumao]
MATKNWVGQEFKPGDIVWRGARDNNLTDCKLGVVLEAENGRVQVHWLFRHGAYRVGTDWTSGAVSIDQKSRVTADVVVKLDPSTLDSTIQAVLENHGS